MFFSRRHYNYMSRKKHVRKHLLAKIKKRDLNISMPVPRATVCRFAAIIKAIRTTTIRAVIAMTSAGLTTALKSLGCEK